MAYNSVKVGEKHLAELGSQLKEMVGSDPPASSTECVTFVKGRRDEWALSDAEVIKARPQRRITVCRVVADLRYHRAATYDTRHTAVLRASTMKGFLSNGAQCQPYVIELRRRRKPLLRPCCVRCCIG